MKRDLALLISIASLLGLTTPTAGQDAKPKGNVAVDQASIDKAIDKGLAYLKGSDSPNTHVGDSDELKLLTHIEGGTPEGDAAVQTLLKKCIDAPLEKTYKVALLAMCLESLDRVKYQPKIAQCGQFLLDNVKPNGGFAYGEPTAFANDVTYPMPKRDVASGGAKAPKAPEVGEGKAKPEVKNKIRLSKKKEGPAQRSDNSNCQYAALGMRACHDAGIVFPKEIITLCRQYWVATQHPGEKGGNKNDKPSVASGVGASIQLGEPRGWCYSDGQAWLDKNWSVTENVGPPETARGSTTGWLYYFLYALERTGMLYDTALIGNHDWYLDGARILLGAQKGDGSWDASHFKHPTWDTCFAILFLKRATKRLVASTGK